MNDSVLKRKAFTSIVWKFLERILAQSVSLIVSIIIARIISTSDYSVVSVVSIFFAFANVLISGGLNTALIQKKEADSIDYSSVLVLSIILSLIIYAVLFFFAPAISRLYSQELLVPVIRVMGLILPISALKSIICAYISSNLDFKKFFYATLIGTIASAIIGISMALKGFGAWALVAQQTSNTLIDTVFLWVFSRIKLKMVFSFSRVKSLFKYGWKILFSSLINTVYYEASPLFIGARFSPVDLSYYDKGRSFPSLLSSVSNSTLSAVLFPVLVNYQDDKERLLYCTRLYIRLASFFCFPIMLGLFSVADTFVDVVLTSKWAGCVYYLEIYCLSTMLDVIAVGNCETIKAMGRSDIYLILEIVKKTCYFIVIACFIFFSSSPKIIAISSIVCTVISTIVNSIPNIKIIGYKIKLQLFDIIPNFISSIIMCISVLYFKSLHFVEGFLLLACEIVLGIVVYLLIAIITQNKSFIYSVSLLKQMIHKGELYEQG